MFGLASIPLRLWLILGALVVVALVSGYTGRRLCQADLQPKLVEEQARTRELSAAYETLKQETAQQNQAIEALKQDTQKRAEAATVAVNAAHIESGRIRERVVEVLREKQAPQMDACLAAQKSFDDELRAERSP